MPERLAESGPDLAADDAVVDPELADGRIRVGQRQAVGRSGVGEVGGVEVHAHALRLGPVDPPLEVRRLEGVALDLLSPGLGIAGMEVEPVSAGNQSQSLVHVGSELVGRTGPARIVAGNRQAPAQLGAGVLEAADIIALPAVQ